MVFAFDFTESEVFSLIIIFNVPYILYYRVLHFKIKNLTLMAFLNISKKKLLDQWDFYRLSRKKRRNYIKQWWTDYKKYKFNKRHTSCINGDFISEYLITAVRCDEETSWRLYDQDINFLSINIFPLVKCNKEKTICLYLKVHLHSIDDSSYGLWFPILPYEEYVRLRKEIMQWVNIHCKNLNGEELLKFCQSLVEEECEIAYN